MNLTSISLPNSIADIGTYAFSYCTSLANISIPVGRYGWGYNESFPYKPLWKNEMEKWLKELL